jgi:hypothetical protein
MPGSEPAICSELTGEPVDMADSNAACVLDTLGYAEPYGDEDAQLFLGRVLLALALDPGDAGCPAVTDSALRGAPTRRLFLGSGRGEGRSSGASVGRGAEVSGDPGCFIQILDVDIGQLVCRRPRGGVYLEVGSEGAPGMPAERWWEFEDTTVNLPAIGAGPPDLARLLVVEFANVYGNDHWVVPRGTECGTDPRDQ